MRIALLLAALPLPTYAWDFSADPICTLTHQTEQAEIAITFDANTAAKKGANDAPFLGV